ncbi:Uncharacterised protein [uncultured archaeon]|nr:Uncharacterised protein [uncultured archaeon]
MLYAIIPIYKKVVTAMQDKYAGDIGDFGKYILLNKIYEKSDGKIKLGINWFYVKDDRTNGYLKDERYKKCFQDFQKLDDLKKIVSDGRSIKRIEETGILPKTTIFYSEPIPSSSKRECWFENSLKILENADIIFLDPDNGIRTNKVERKPKAAAKYVFIDEIEKYYEFGKSLIIYNHFDRKPKEYNKKINEIKNNINQEIEIKVLRFKKVSVRDFIFLIQKPHQNLLDRTINNLLNKPYDFLFEKVKGLP